MKFDLASFNRSRLRHSLQYPEQQHNNNNSKITTTTTNETTKSFFNLFYISDVAVAVAAAACFTEIFILIPRNKNNLLALRECIEPVSILYLYYFILFSTILCACLFDVN